MRRQKRDRSERAFSRGYMAGVEGRPKDLCPFGGGTTRNQWMSGWHEGRSDQWDGYTGVSGLHKMQLH